MQVEAGVAMYHVLLAAASSFPALWENMARAASELSLGLGKIGLKRRLCSGFYALVRQ